MGAYFFICPSHQEEDPVQTLHGFQMSQRIVRIQKALHFCKGCDKFTAVTDLNALNGISRLSGVKINSYTFSRFLALPGIPSALWKKDHVVTVGADPSSVLIIIGHPLRFVGESPIISLFLMYRCSHCGFSFSGGGNHFFWLKIDKQKITSLLDFKREYSSWQELLYQN